MSFFVSKILSKWLLSSKNLLYLRFPLGFSFVCFYLLFVLLFFVIFFCFSLAFGVINLRLSLPHLAKTHVYTKNCLYHLSYVIYLFLHLLLLLQYPPLLHFFFILLFPDTFQSNIFVLFSVCGKSYYIICMCECVCGCECVCWCFFEYFVLFLLW